DLFRPGQVANDLARDVGDGDLDVAARRGFQVIADGRSRRRVLSTEVLGPAGVAAERYVIEPLSPRSDVEQMSVGGERLLVQLLKRGNVVDDPDSAPVRARDQIVVARVDQQGIHTYVRQPGH